MNRLNKVDLLELVVRSIMESGWNVIKLTNISEHPVRLQINRDDESYRIRLYIWNLTHGGGAARPSDEYRIQITGVERFEQSPRDKTIVLGWWQEGEVFAGFDVRKHSGTLGKSPSIQVREACLRKAYLNGFSPCDKGNQEIVIAFRPDFLVEYIRTLEPLHNFGQSPEGVAELNLISENLDLNNEDIQISDNSRKTIVVSVSKRLRDVNFRRRVLTAYSFRCAVCGVQLGLVDAAHIIPVNHEKSTDETRNGLTLCVLHHRAYDQALLSILEDYSIHMNPLQVTNLKRQNLQAGLDAFSQNLRSMLLLPPAISDRPHVEYIRLANEIRQVNP